MFKNKMRKKLFSKIIGVVFVLFVISHFVPIPYQVMEPGIAAELSPMIDVKDGYENKGDFFLTAVSSRRAVAWDFAYITLFSPEDQELTSITEQLPEDMDMNEYIDLMSKLMEESKLQAQAVAFRKTGHQVKITGDGAEIVRVMKEGSAYNKLKKDDLIVEIDGQKVEMAADAVNIIKNREIGDMVKITVLRDGEKKTFELKTVELEGNKDTPSIGVLISSKNLDYDIPGEVEFHTENIIGPSAGSVFTMEIYNQLTPKDITGGKKIAGTGTISLDGKIGRIDGVKYKIMTAKEKNVDLFIVPAENYEKAAKYAGGLKLLKVKNIDDIINYLKNELEA